MKSLKFLLIGLIAAVSVVSSCKKDNNDDEIEVFAPETLSGQITSDKTLTSDRVWILNGYVRVMSGATLTIEAGTIIRGDKVSNAALIVERGGKIMASGTANSPIVFTSNQPAGQRSIGDWAGLIICGKAPINQTGGEAQYESGVLGTDVAKYGGTIATDNSGVLKYVRIEYAGIALAQDKEINSLTLAAVGSGTTIENVQASFGGDDAFEFFGGTVNCKNLIAYRCTDDDFDFEYGYVGRIQYAISMKDPNIYDASASGASNGVESDNGSTVNDVPANKPMLSNFTFIGPGANANAKHNAGVIFRKGSRFVLRNSIIIDHLKSAFELATVEAGDRLFAGESEFKNNLVFANQAIYKVSSAGTNFPDAGALTTFANTQSNTTLANAAAAGITSISLTAPNLTLTAGSVAKTGANFTGLTGFDVVTYRGAMDTNNWVSGWANFSPNTTEY